MRVSLKTDDDNDDDDDASDEGTTLPEVACVGDSITDGIGESNALTCNITHNLQPCGPAGAPHSWPGQLQTMLSNFTVRNFGHVPGWVASLWGLVVW